MKAGEPMKRLLFLTNIPSPYRVKFFEELGKTFDVTVLFHDDSRNHTGRANNWFGQGNGSFHQVQLEKCVFSRGEDSLCLDVLGWLKQPFDAVIVCGYASLTEMLAIAYLRMKKKPFFLEVDGGLVRPDSGMKYRLKKWLVSSADGWISSGKYTTDYLLHYGADPDRTYEYPFTSLQEADIQDAVTTAEEKTALRQQLNIPEEKCVLSIGQFIPRKGFDVLLKAAANLDKETGIYIVGGEPTEEYLRLREELGLNNVHFVGFQDKEALAKYYRASDVFVLPTREDIWGLVINEAMAYGLPVITTDRCVAGLTLIENGTNGCIVPTGNAQALAEAIQNVFAADCLKLGAASLEKIRPYTIENMAKAHAEILK